MFGITVGRGPDFVVRRGKVRIQYHCTVVKHDGDGNPLQDQIVRDYSLWNLAQKVASMMGVPCGVDRVTRDSSYSRLSFHQGGHLRWLIYFRPMDGMAPKQFTIL